MITQSELKERLHYDPETGVFTWITSVKHSSVKVGDIAGYVDVEGYIKIQIKEKQYKAHRLVWLYMTGSWPKNNIDHIKHIRHDNRFSQLRDATREDNDKNQSFPKNNTSGVMGVCWSKRDNRWQSNIGVNRRLIHLGYFIDKFEAVCARKSAERKYGYHKNHGVVK